jgi:chromosome segregation ATPase
MLIQRYGKLAKWRKEQMHPHAFRHSFATEYVRRGGKVEALRQIMNHADLKTTQIYTHLAQEDVEQDHRRVLYPGEELPESEEPHKALKCPHCGDTQRPGFLRCMSCQQLYQEPEDLKEIVKEEIRPLEEAIEKYKKMMAAADTRHTQQEDLREELQQELEEIKRTHKELLASIRDKEN